MYELIFYLWKEIAPRVEGPAGQGGKNAANVELAWHFYACCEPCVASASAGDSEWWARLRLKQATEKKTCKADIGEDTFTRRRELIYLIYLLLTFVLVDTFLSYSLAKHGEGEPFLSPPSRPVRLEGSDSERLCTLRPRFLAAAASEQWVCARAAGQVSVEIVSEIWREERACLESANSMCRCGEWAFWTWPRWIVQTGEVHQRGDITALFFLTKTGRQLSCSRVINTRLNPLIYVHFQVFIEVKVPHIWCINKLCVSELLKGQYVGF